MAALIQTDWAIGKLAMPQANDASLVGVRLVKSLSVAENVTGNIIEMGILPAYTQILDAMLDADSLAASAMTMDVGIMSGTAGDTDAGGVRTMDAVIFSASTIGVAGGIARATLKTMCRIVPTAADRGIGLKILLQGATPAAGLIGLTLWYRSAPP